MIGGIGYTVYGIATYDSDVEDIPCTPDLELPYGLIKVNGIHGFKKRLTTFYRENIKIWHIFVDLKGSTLALRSEGCVPSPHNSPSE